MLLLICTQKTQGRSNGKIQGVQDERGSLSAQRASRCPLARETPRRCKTAVKRGEHGFFGFTFYADATASTPQKRKTQRRDGSCSDGQFASSLSIVPETSTSRQSVRQQGLAAPQCHVRRQRDARTSGLHLPYLTPSPVLEHYPVALVGSDDDHGILVTSERNLTTTTV